MVGSKSQRTGALSVGEPAPWFIARSPVNPRFHFDSVAGRYIVLCFFGSANEPVSRQILVEVLARRERFDDEYASFFGVSCDPDDERLGRVEPYLPGFHLFWDFDLAVSRQYGIAIDADQGIRYRPMTLILDPRLRVAAVLPIGEDPKGHVGEMFAVLERMPKFAASSPAMEQAPVLIVPQVFEPELCRELIAYYERHGGEESGFMREVNGRTVGVMDPQFKRRRDQDITDETLRRACMVRIHDRLVPEISKAFQFQATRMERYIVACYTSESQGFFRPHRDNTTRGTAHRRFAVSLHLNSEEYEGGELRFPEYGRKTYRASTGGAVVFSCSLLHEATPVIRGNRYVFLPFLYDEAAARIREANLQFVDLGPPGVPGMTP